MSLFSGSICTHLRGWFERMCCLTLPQIATVVRSLQDVERLQAGVPGHLEERYYRIEYNGVTGHGSSTFMSMVGGCNKNCLCPFFAASLTLCNSIGPALHDKRFIFCAQAKKLGVMDNEKAMVPRGAFKGVLQFRHAGVRPRAHFRATY